MAFLEDTLLLTALVAAFACGILVSQFIVCRLLFPRSLTRADAPVVEAPANLRVETATKSARRGQVIRFPEPPKRNRIRAAAHGVKGRLVKVGSLSHAS